jgi:hypothetical protein
VIEDLHETWQSQNQNGLSVRDPKGWQFLRKNADFHTILGEGEDRNAEERRIRTMGTSQLPSATWI